MFVGGAVSPQCLLLLGANVLEGCLEQVVCHHIPSKVQEVIKDVNLPLLLDAIPQHGLHLRSAGMRSDDQDQANAGRQQRCQHKEDDGTQGHHPIHLGIEAGSTSDETGDDEGQDDEGAHEELSGVGEQEDGVFLQFQREEAVAEAETADDTGECDQE